MASISIEFQNDGQVIEATMADTVVIRLPETPTSGVRWEFDELDAALQPVGDDYELSPGGGIGAASIRVLSLKPNQPGEYPIRLKRLQQWEGESSTDATFGVTLHVRP